MSRGSSQFDVVIVGASLAGCTAARLFAQRGLSVALVEQHADVHWHKRICTHYIQACAAPTIQRLGLDSEIERAGGVRSRMQIWTRWGWIRHAGNDSETFGYSIRRETLDPIVRRLALDTPGVTWFGGNTVEGLLGDRQRYEGVVLCDRAGERIELSAKLVVGADGRNSTLVKLADVPIKSKPNQRFAYFAYYRNLPLRSGDDAQFWMLDPDAAYALPNEDGITLLCCWVTKDKLPEFRADREAAFARLMESLPDGPELPAGERISELLGAMDMPVDFHWAARAHLALIGDAALAPDPLWGVGCGWAFQSAEWLVEEAAPALAGGGDVEKAINVYRERHRAALGAHWWFMGDYARGRKFRAVEKIYYRAGVRDAVTAETLLAFGARRISPLQLMRPDNLARAVWANCRRAPTVAGTSESLNSDTVIKAVEVKS